MKRDWELIRTILIKVRDQPSHTVLEIEAADNDVVEEHFKLLEEAGLVEYEEMYGGDRTAFTARLTWYGHDFIESAQDEKRYASAIEKARAAGSMSFEMLKAILAEFAKQAVFGA